jgi:hypothetical protein
MHCEQQRPCASTTTYILQFLKEHSNDQGFTTTKPLDDPEFSLELIINVNSQSTLSKCKPIVFQQFKRKRSFLTQHKAC